MPSIVIGTDGSPNSAAALDWAVNEAKLRDATLKVVHTWHETYVGTYPYSVADTSAVLEKAATEVLASIADGAEAALGRPVERVVRYGATVPSLVEEAAEADLLVVGTRGHGGFTGLLLGSVSASLAHHTPCPLVIVPSSPDE